MCTYISPAPQCKSSSLFAVAALPRGNQNELKLRCFMSVLVSMVVNTTVRVLYLILVNVLKITDILQCIE